jgi:hypothetical protein
MQQRIETHARTTPMKMYKNTRPGIFTDPLSATFFYTLENSLTVQSLNSLDPLSLFLMKHIP